MWKEIKPMPPRQGIPKLDMAPATEVISQDQLAHSQFIAISSDEVESLIGEQERRFKAN